MLVMDLLASEEFAVVKFMRVFGAINFFRCSKNNKLIPVIQCVSLGFEWPIQQHSTVCFLPSLISLDCLYNPFASPTRRTS